MGLARIRRRIFGARFDSDPHEHSIEIPTTNSESDLKIKLHLAPQRLEPFEPGKSRPVRLCLTIEGLKVRTNERALKALETTADSLLFELDTRFDISLSLVKVRAERLPSTGGIARQDQIERKPLQFPECQYDRQPISLYWYGRGADGLPLLRFLAFYQSLEFYFPMFSQYEAVKQARALLKDPRFSIHDDKDITLLLSAIQTGRAGSFGDERSQLKATIMACLNAEALRLFLTADERRKNFYCESSIWKGVSAVKLAINDTSLDLRGAVADRLYDIRCRIVHTKIDGGVSRTEVLLPFSKEADDLYTDIDLIQYVARQVLITTSTKFSV